jgi:predicted aspartyl protease
MLVRAAETAASGISIERTPTGHLVTGVTVGDSARVPFLLDTGAGATVVSPWVLEGLNYRESAVPGTIHGALGPLSPTRQVVRGQLRVETGQTSEVAMTVFPLDELSEQVGTPLGGILGLDFLSSWAVRFDFSSLRLCLSEASWSGSPSSSHDGFVQQQCWSEEETLIVVSVNAGTDTCAIVDTGSPVVVLNSAAAVASGVHPESDERPRAAASGIGTTRIAALARPLGPIEFGGYSFPTGPAYVCDLPIFETLGIGSSPAMLLGVSFFERRVLAIDFRERKVMVSTDV